MFFSKKKKDAKPKLSVEEQKAKLKQFIEAKVEEDEDYIKKQKESLSKELSKLELVFDNGYVITKEFYDSIRVYEDSQRVFINEYGECFYSTLFSYPISDYYISKDVAIIPASLNREEFIDKIQKQQFIDLQDNGKLTNVSSILEIRKL